MSFILFIITFDWLIIAAQSAVCIWAECHIRLAMPTMGQQGWSCHWFAIPDPMYPEKLMLIFSVNLTTTKSSQTNQPQVSLIQININPFWWSTECSVGVLSGKYFQPHIVCCHLSGLFLCLVKIFYYVTVASDMWNLPGMFHVSSISERDPLWWGAVAT